MASSAQRRGADQLREQATKAFEEVSVLLDQRLYRMRRVYWAAKRLAPVVGGDTSNLEAELSDYRSVLRQWNDNLNRILAIVHSHFGEPIRQRLQVELYDRFAAIGEELDEFVREVSRRERGPVRVRAIGGRLTDLSHRVYSFNVVLLGALHDDRLGDSVPSDPAYVATPDHPRFGCEGGEVRALQEALRHAGAVDLKADGHFGRATERALSDFQRTHGLVADGVAGPKTLRALEATVHHEDPTRALTGDRLESS